MSSGGIEMVYSAKMGQLNPVPETVRNISREKLNSINTDKNQISISQMRIQQSFRISQRASS